MIDVGVLKTFDTDRTITQCKIKWCQSETHFHAPKRSHDTKTTLGLKRKESPKKVMFNQWKWWHQFQAVLSFCFSSWMTTRRNSNKGLSFAFLTCRQFQIQSLLQTRDLRLQWQPLRPLVDELNLFVGRSPTKKRIVLFFDELTCDKSQKYEITDYIPQLSNDSIHQRTRY